MAKLQQVSIERALPSDAEEMMAVQNLAFRQDVMDYGECPSYLTNVDEMVSKISDAIFYKFVTDGQIVGGIELYMRSDDWCHIYMLCVHPDYHDRGIGTQALSYVFEAHSNVAKWTLITPSGNGRSRHLYEKMGFVVTDTRAHSPKLTLVRYERLVSSS